jgi:polyphosphate kinase
VRSIVGRFLEHSRIFHFANGGDEDFYVGSADWMARNLRNRIEVVAPVESPSAKAYLKDVLLTAYLSDNVRARELQSDGSYRRISRQNEPDFDSQAYFIGRTPSNV